MGTFELAIVGFAGSGIGVALGLPMLWPNRRADGLRLMGVWILGVAALVAIISARLVRIIPPGAAAEHGINLIGLTVYPLVYLYVWRQTRTLAQPRRAWWLWIPAGVYGAAIVVRAALGGSTRVPFGWILPIVLLFTLACAALLVGRDRERSDALVPPEWIVALLVVLNAAQIVRMEFGGVPPFAALIPLVLTLEFAALVGLVAWRAAQPSRLVAVAGVAGVAARYERSGLGDDEARVVWDQVERALGQDRLFVDPDLTLSRLAAAVGASPHHVSEATNRHGGMTFHDLLNRHRVADVKAQLADPSADRYTIEGIGASAGFRSRSALYAAFRRLEGMTPAQYRNGRRR